MSHDIKIRITAEATNVKSTIDGVKSQLNGIKSIKANNGSMKTLETDAKSASRAVKETGNAMKETQAATSRFKGILGGMGGMIAGAFGVGAVLGFGKAAISAAADMELLKKGLEFSLGSAATEKLISDIQQIGEASAYDSTQLLPLARAWVNIGDSAETARSKIAKIVDAGSAYGMTADQVGRVNLALTQMQMKGKISAEEMMQLTEAGLPAWNLLSEAMGVPIEELQSMATKGELTQDAMNALFDGMQNKTQGAASSLANTLMGQFSNIEEAARNSMAGIGDMIVQAFDLSTVLTDVGEFVQSFKAHILNMRDAAKSVGVGQAFCNELEAIDPTLGTIANTGVAAFNEIANAVKSATAFLMEHKTATLAVIEVIGSIAATVAIWTGVTRAIAATQVALGAAKVAALAFRAACMANPVLLAISAIVAILVLLVTHWDDVKEAAEQAWNTVCGWASKALGKINDVIQGIKNFFSALSQPATVQVTQEVTTIRKAVDESGGGIPGAAKGGLFGGAVPLANGGQLKHGTHAIVGEAGPEAVIPLKDNVLAKIGESILSSYEKGKAGKGNTLAQIQAKITTAVDTPTVDAYAKVLAAASEKAKAIGEEINKFNEYQKQANEEVEKYAADGEKTVAVNEKIASITEQIANLQAKVNEGKAKDGDADKIARLTDKRDRIQVEYEEEKQAAINAAKEAANARAGIEQSAQDTINQIRTNALEKYYSRETALEQAKLKEKQASTATELSDYMAMMAEKDDITGQSFATTLANEALLNEQRQIWHEQMMLNASTWGEYMNTLLLSIGQSLQSNLAEGLTNCIMKGESLASVLSNLATTLATTLIKGVLEKAISSLGIIGSLSNQNSKTEIANATKEAAAQSAKTAAMAANATAAVIAANPWAAAGAGTLVATQLSLAAKGSQMLSLATGGAVVGSGTGTSDSIPAMLSNGEYVINARAASLLGNPALNMLNNGIMPTFADGGTVGSTSNAGAQQAGNTVSLSVNTLDASSFTDFLRNGGLDTLRQALFENNRNFASEAGLF